MTSLLVLLALLSVATLAARRGALGEILGGASTPVPVVFGLVLGPAGLGFLAPSVVDGLGPALAVGVCVLGLIAGMRAAAPIAYERPDRRTLVPLLDLVLIGAALFGAARLAVLPIDLEAAPATSLLAAALLAAACLGAPASSGSEARFAKIAALVLAAAAVGLASPLALVAVLGFGAVGALAVLLIGGPSAGPTFVAALGAITLIAGASLVRGVPGVLAGVVVGAIVSRSRAGSVLSPLAERAERPVRIVVAVVIAAAAPMSVEAAVLGAGLAGIALAVATTTLGATFAARTGALASSSLALALAASLTATGVAPTLLAPLLIAVAVVDAVALLTRLAVRSPAARA
ncbi:MAG: hypothetical protein HYS27_02210 [Deltaproteobacteria bacterium]|nr:hypothetical protein [Deltaproteobacteria bacterium]